MKSLFKKILILSAALAVSFILLEGLMRLAGKDFAQLWMPDGELGWKHIPGARKHCTDEGDGMVQINALGQRDRERQLEKQAGVYRIAIFGDSITEANQVNLDQDFCQLLEQKAGTPEKPLEALNFGVSGYSPVQYLLSLRQNGPRYHPDCALWTVFLDNDVAGCHPKLNPSAGAPPYARFEGDAVSFDFSRAQKSVEDYQKQPQNIIRSWSCVYRFLSETRQRIAGQKAVRSGEGEASVPRRFLLYQKSTQPEWEEAWQNFEKLLIEFKKEAERQKIDALILSVPAAQTVNDKSWESILKQEPAMAGKEWALDGPEKRLAELCRKHSIPLVQIFDDFRARSSKVLYFGNLGHLTPLGHQLVADKLAAHFKSRK